MTEKRVKELITPIIIAKIKTIKKHENADRLIITKIDVGNAEIAGDLKDKDGLIQIVTAAKNVQEGDLVPFLPPGNLVSGWIFTKNTEIRLESRPMRGEISHGMILAEDEIGLSGDHEAIMVLNKKVGLTRLTQEEVIGKSIIDILSEDDIKILNKTAGVIEITPELQKRIDLIASIGSDETGGEIVGLDELPQILSSDEALYAYDGFEPSGQMHIAQGIIRSINTNKMIEAGFTFRMWVADWFGYLNNKMGGDIDKIKTVGTYFIEIWRAAGMNLNGVEFLWTSDAVKDHTYWETVMKISRSTTLKRILRTTEIMGRSETDELNASQILYPAMQIADIFHVMKCQVTQLGLDQRKVNMLAREIGEEIGYWKPVVVSHGMLQGLAKPLPKDADATERAISMKMSKSKPDTAIFMTDSLKEIQRKINKAYCPEGEVEDNPILDYVKQIIFEAHYLNRTTELLKNGEFVVERSDKHGGNLVFSNYKELENEYIKGGDAGLHPADLKKAVIKYLDELIQPVRKHFETDKEAKKLLEKVQSFKVTR